MAKKHEQIHSLNLLMIAFVSIVAIVGVSAMAFNHWRWAATTPGFGNAPEWAGLTPETQNPGQTGGNLKPFGSLCSSDSQCESGSCSGDVYDKKGELTNHRVCI